MRVILETSYREVELLETPGLAVVEIGATLVERLLQLQKAVKEHKMYHATEFNYEVRWTQLTEDDRGETVPGSPLRTECDMLRVGETEFWWTCYVKHSDVVLDTERVKISELTKENGNG